jgi:hypothetical protein
MHSSAEAIIESPTDSYSDIPGGVQFTGSRSMARTLPPQPTGLDADDHGTYTYRPRPTGPDGAGFSMTRH